MPISSFPISVRSSVNLSDINIDTDLDLSGRNIINIGATTLNSLKRESIWINPTSILEQKTINYPDETIRNSEAYNKHLDLDLDTLFWTEGYNTIKFKMKLDHKCSSGTSRIGLFVNDVLGWEIVTPVDVTGTSYVTQTFTTTTNPDKSYTLNLMSYNPYNNVYIKNIKVSSLTCLMSNFTINKLAELDFNGKKITGIENIILNPNDTVTFDGVTYSGTANALNNLNPSLDFDGKNTKEILDTITGTTTITYTGYPNFLFTLE